nr:MAG TPA: hypothetical protein [Caudoviricetes sp.]
MHHGQPDPRPRASRHPERFAGAQLRHRCQ